MTSAETVRPAVRLQFWDVAKGIVILLVIIGHASGVDPMVRQLIFSFHMPFFFIANGYFIKRYDIRSTVRKSARSLLVPYAVVCFLSAVLCVVKNTGTEPGYRVFALRIVDMFAGMSKISTHFQQFESVWLVWFVICLFAARVIYVCCMHYLERLPAFVAPIVMLLLAAAGWAVGEYYAFLPWSLDVARVALPFLWCGNRLKDVIGKKYWPILAAVCAVVWCVTAVLGVQIEMATRSYPLYYLCLVTAAAGSVFFVGISQLVDKYCPRLRRFFAWCGRNSMILLAFHCLEMRFFDWNTLIFAGLPFSLGWLGKCVVKLLLILPAAWLVVQLKELVRFLNTTESVRA